jgi:hypothetical protein
MSAALDVQVETVNSTATLMAEYKPAYGMTVEGISASACTQLPWLDVHLVLSFRTHLFETLW